MNFVMVLSGKGIKTRMKIIINLFNPFEIYIMRQVDIATK
ncbi:hypothetical protein MNB_SUP05-12-502 [hydrothermal vent metagenome]|uniref:Uncharacterized protein n=1 Tax=hydrothermal vent metagenome TaxID=652676 RepID=A0A1W1DIW7_9ZZZZ